MNGLRVIIVDDQELFREGLKTVLSMRSGIVIVGDASDGEEALRLCASTHPDVVLMDIKMPVLDGIATTRRIRAAYPDCKVVALTTFDDDELVFEALRAGAVAYLLKDACSERVVEAIHAAARGETILQPSLVGKVVSEFTRLSARAPSPSGGAQLLSERETDVLRLIARGASNKEIASALSVAEGTVKNHVTSVLAKLKVTDRTQAALRARDLGIV